MSASRRGPSESKPDGNGGVLVLGREPPKEYRGALRQVEQSMTEIVELNRQILRQSREIERQRNELEKTVRELEESDRGLRTLHSELEDSAEVARRATSMKSRVIANVESRVPHAAAHDPRAGPPSARRQRWRALRGAAQADSFHAGVGRRAVDARG